MLERGTLAQLAVKHQSDKWGAHSYTTHYEIHFHPYRDKKINILEIGVGGYDATTMGGGSLKMWRDYFPLANIFALDIVDKSLHSTDRVRIYQGNQTDTDILRDMHNESGGFDIVIDDGSHNCRDVITTFGILFPLLKNDGIYIIEDVQTSYWPAFGGSSDHPDSEMTTMGYFKSLIHGINHVEITRDDHDPSYLDTSILSIHFYHNLIILYKGDNTEPSNVARHNPVRAAR